MLELNKIAWEGLVLNLSELWKLYKADKRIQEFNPLTSKAYSLQLNILIREIGDVELDEVSLPLLKGYLAKQSERLKPSSLGHRIRFIRSLFCDSICSLTIGSRGLNNMLDL
jgi:hypothetical protein